MRYRLMRYPGGKPKALTLSYDDGIRADLKLCEILKKYGLKCTFNINSGSLTLPSMINPNRLTVDEIKEHIVGAGHEIAVHGRRHLAPGIASAPVAIKDVLDCRTELEEIFGTVVRGMAYPDTGITKIHYPNSFASIRSYLSELGIVYSRTLSADNNSFMLPEDFLAWVPTAHHNNPNLMKWADEFIEADGYHKIITRRYPRLFYLWGHSYEFDNNDNWDVIERFAEKMSGRSDIWYATNIEIYEYVEAYGRLVTSADGSRIYNPTVTEVFMHIDGKEYSVKPGETLVL
ncbi:MAG: polysaccharide deacetylase family protein [Clostridia bacterium]|nr:polysaccharide deacetylase family protein [Clostridia bacterium]